MFKPVPLAIGLRYTRAKRRNHFISFISFTSMLGVAVGVMALITVLSVMNGFDNELRSRMLGMTAHASVLAFGGPLRAWTALMGPVRAHPEVLGAAPFIQGEAMVVAGGDVNGVMVNGILPEEEARISLVAKKMVAGRLGDLVAGEYRIVLGRYLARKLLVDVGDRVTLIAPQAVTTPAGIIPRMRRFTVAGVFEVGMNEYDGGLVLVHLDDARRLFRLPDDAVTGIRLKVSDLYQAHRIANEVVKTLPGDHAVMDWTQYHQNFFRALKTEKLAMFVILSLIVAVAAFNIVSTLVMVVADKRAEIAILRTLGLSPRGVMAIFVVQGTVIGLFGTLLGVGGGIWLATHVTTLVPALEQALGVQFMPSDVYFITDLPSDLDLHEVAEIAIFSFALSVLATLYPAWAASRQPPAEALRYE
jgi:lipoprotein-releasing system permease protein